eukprot:3631201-Rhodomonas_salina.1
MAEPIITVQKRLFSGTAPPLNYRYDVRTPAECITHSQCNAERRLRAQRAKEYGTELEADISMQEPQEQVPISKAVVEQTDQVPSEMPCEPALAAQTEEQMDGDMDCDSEPDVLSQTEAEGIAQEHDETQSQGRVSQESLTTSQEEVCFAGLPADRAHWRMKHCKKSVGPKSTSNIVTTTEYLPATKNFTAQTMKRSVTVKEGDLGG